MTGYFYLTLDFQGSFSFYSCFILSYRWVVLPAWIYHIVFIRWTGDRHLGCLHHLAVVNMATTNISCKPLCEHMFLFLLSIYTVIEVPGHMVTLCPTFWKQLDCFSKQLHHFTFPQQHMRIPFTTYPCQYLWWFAFLTAIILEGLKWYFIVF